MNLVDCVKTGTPAPFKVYDMHAHLGHFNYGMPSIDPATIVDTMDRLGVQSAICSHLMCICRDVHWGNDKVAAAIKKYPGRILGYISLFPGSEAEVQAESELRISQGFTGFKFHSSNGFAYDDTAYAPSWKLAEQYKMPILYHTWGERETMNQILSVASKTPNAPILLGHSTSCHIEEYVRAAKSAPNIYLELCTSGVPLGAVEKLIEQVGVEKIVWGSDCLFYSMAQQFGRIAGSHLSDEEKRMILSGNAQRILGYCQ